MKLRRLSFPLFLAAGLFLNLAFAASAPMAGRRNQSGMCPVMPGSRVDPKFYVDYGGRRILLCCKACKKAFKKHPEWYVRNLEPTT